LTLSYEAGNEDDANWWVLPTPAALI